MWLISQWFNSTFSRKCWKTILWWAESSNACFIGTLYLHAIETVLCIGFSYSSQPIGFNSQNLKIQTGTALTYEKYYELLILSAKTHYNKFKQDSKFGSKSRPSVYDIKQCTNDDDNNSFDIEYYVDIIQAYAY